MMINCTNHPFDKWGEEQKRAAMMAYGAVEDFPFPAVSPSWDSRRLAQEAEALCAQMAAMKPDAVLCQREMGLTCAVAYRLWRRGIPALHACSERVACERRDAEGRTVKTSVFAFCAFREYVFADEE